MHVIYINYYSDSNLERCKEYLECISRNQELDFIDRIIVFLENDKDRFDIVDRKKLEFIDLGRRLEFRDVIDHASRELPDNTIVTILNLDIYLDNSDAWRNIDRDYFQRGNVPRALVVKRHNLDIDRVPSKEDKWWHVGNFCDAWILKTPFDPEFVKENLWFCVGGAPGCDNVMMFLMNAYYHTFSWGDKYRVFHLDICRKQGETKMITNSKTDWRASVRKSQHLSIPAYQDWEQLLATDQRPEVFIYKKRYVHTNIAKVVDEPQVYHQVMHDGNVFKTYKGAT